MIQLRKWTILIHRYLGMALSLLFAVWFVSGIAMIYARGMPSLTPEVRLEHLPAIDLDAVKLTAAEAAEKAGFEPFGGTTLLTVMGRPAYRFAGQTVFADTGELLESVGEEKALKIASSFINLPEAKLQYEGRLDRPDQWTISEAGQLPMYKFAVDDDARTHLYVSQASAEVGLLTTRGTRALAWVAAIPHWFYFAPLRLNGSMWRRAVLWTSGIGAILTLLGLVLGVIQFSTRYTGLMRWHYISGIAFGVFCLTWVFSGMLSMEPYFWASGGGTGAGIEPALSGSPVDLSAYPAMDPAAWNAIASGRAIKEVEFVGIQDRPLYIAHGIEPEPLLIEPSPLRVRSEPFSLDSVMTRVKEGNPDVPIAESRLLSDYDSYYHPRDRKPPLPVVRVQFADADSTWFYIDPHMSEVVTAFTRRQRLQRWIYHGFHSLDFNFWYYQGAAWQVAMITLNAGGALLSIIGVVLSVKRLKRGFRRAKRSGFNGRRGAVESLP